MQMYMRTIIYTCSVCIYIYNTYMHVKMKAKSSIALPKDQLYDACTYPRETNRQSHTNVRTCTHAPGLATTNSYEGNEGLPARIFSYASWPEPTPPTPICSYMCLYMCLYIYIYIYVCMYMRTV